MTPHITFGIIVLNGEPFTRYNLRALYPFAHEIIVVEGASLNAAHAAMPDGHSTDGTLEILQRFQANEDPEGKITIVTAEDEGYPNGFWPGEKDEQSRAYAKRATGNWLWQIDIDEFYLEDDMQRVIDLLTSDPSITTVTFPEIPFWGSFDVRCDGILLRMEYSKFHRLFKWEAGYTMITHRPPTVTNTEGRDLRQIHWLNDKFMEDMGIYLHHYTQIFPHQVSNKMVYYEKLLSPGKGNTNWIGDADKWLNDSFFSLRNPYRVHTVNKWTSWLVYHQCHHPSQIQALQLAITSGDVNTPMRNMKDVDELLSSRGYQFGIMLCKNWGNYITQADRAVRMCWRGDIGVCEFFKCILHIIIGKQRLF